MKNLLLSLILIAFCISAFAQDEGEAVAKARFDRDKSFYVAGGLALPFGGKLDDYGNGVSFEGGFLKRLNKVLSLGGNLSYLSMKYDPANTYPYYYNVSSNYAIELEIDGGDVTMLSAGFVLKLNFIPVSDNSTLSIYGIANPFVAQSTRSEMEGRGYFYENLDSDGQWNDPVSGLFPDVWDATDFPILSEETKITGGVQVGFGLEFMPVKPVSFFLQTTVGYTGTISYISTQDYLSNAEQYVDGNGTIYYDADPTYYNPQFPILKSGFPALSVRFGLSFNF
ncbi:MAG: hypothetical protein L6Q51_11685 [Cyclobacteriaceae bacterium]|nr:hypothetical protein [Cyclobacteriaceae bacterium]